MRKSEWIQKKKPKGIKDCQNSLKLVCRWGLGVSDIRKKREQSWSAAMLAVIGRIFSWGENLAQVIRYVVRGKGNNWVGKGNESYGHDWINHRRFSEATTRFAPIMSESSRTASTRLGLVYANPHHCPTLEIHRLRPLLLYFKAK